MSESSGKPRLLFLAHRIPYPPNKGDKIRSFHLLKHLSQSFDIYLGAFVDDPDDWQFCAVVNTYCAETFFVERKPRVHKMQSLTGLLSRQALSVAYYRSRAMQRWVDGVVARTGIERALLFCSPMWQFLAPGTLAGQHIRNCVTDFVDLDSEKWRQYAAGRRGPLRWLYLREAARLLESEVITAQKSQRTYFVSAQEAALFRMRAPDCGVEVGFFQNGVDTAYFNPDPRIPSPYASSAQALVFTGAMDYWPNVEAVTRFANEVFPHLRSVWPDLQFWIVGGKPTRTVRDLANNVPGVQVSGRVADVRPFLQHATAAVAPMNIARGVQNKVLEALAMGKPVIASNAAMVGVTRELFPRTFLASTCAEWIEALGTLISSANLASSAEEPTIATTERLLSWHYNLRPLLEALELPLDS